MYQGKNFSERASIFIKLLLPVLVYQVISYSSGMIGTFMAGHYSPTDLAGVSMGVNIWNPIIPATAIPAPITMPKIAVPNF